MDSMECVRNSTSNINVLGEEDIVFILDEDDECGDGEGYPS